MTSPTLQYEQSAWQKGYRAVAGVDEVGRGSWAGPVVAAAVIVCPTLAYPSASDPRHTSFFSIRDSKQLSARQRYKVADYIRSNAIFTTAIGQSSVEEINHLGVGQATYLAMQRAVAGLPSAVDYILIDGYKNPHLRLPQQPIIKGDSLSLSIAAASIVAKVYRDTLMGQLSSSYPQYHFDQHKGYGTKAHQQAISSYGLSLLHRTSFNYKCLETDRVLR